MDHPMVREIEMWGYPKSHIQEYVMEDSFRNEIYEGDDYFEIDDNIYLVNALSDDAVMILERHGADRKTA